MNAPSTLIEWFSCGAGGLLMLFGLFLAGVNWCILAYNLLHRWIREDGKHTSFIPIIPWACIYIGSVLFAPVADNTKWLCLLDAGLLNLLFLPVYAVWRAMVHMWRVICRDRK